MPGEDQHEWCAGAKEGTANLWGLGAMTFRDVSIYAAFVSRCRVQLPHLHTYPILRKAIEK